RCCTGNGATECLPARRIGRATGHAHAPASALHGGDVAGGPDVSGNAGSTEFPGPLCAPPCMEGRCRRLRCRSALLRRSGEAAGTRSADPGQSDRLGPGPDSRQDEHRCGPQDDVVGAAVEITVLPRNAIAAAREFVPKDARVFQILFLALLLTTGVLLRDFSLHPLQMALAFAAGLATQAFWLKRLAPAVWLLMLGTIVTTRARRLDISWMFLGAFLGLVALRVMLLGQSWAIW